MNDIEYEQISFDEIVKGQLDCGSGPQSQDKSEAPIGTRFVFYDGDPDKWNITPQELLDILLSDNQTEFTIIHWSDDVERHGGPDRHTYRIVKDSSNWWHIEVLYGPDNETDYRTMAVVKFLQTDYTIKPIRIDNEYRPMYMDIICLLNFCTGKVKNLFLREMFLSRRCRYCHRLLTTPESVIRGYGPKCAKKI